MTKDEQVSFQEMTDRVASALEQARSSGHLDDEQVSKLFDDIATSRARVHASIEKLDASVERLDELAKLAAASVAAR